MKLLLICAWLLAIGCGHVAAQNGTPAKGKDCYTDTGSGTLDKIPCQLVHFDFTTTNLAKNGADCPPLTIDGGLLGADAKVCYVILPAPPPFDVLPITERNGGIDPDISPSPFHKHARTSLDFIGE